MPRAKKGELKQLLAHTQVKKFPVWKNTGNAHQAILNLSPKQLALYSAIVDHSKNKTDIKQLYPTISDESIKAIDDLKNHDKHALDSLARNSGSKNSLARWHRKVWSKSLDKTAGGFMSSVGKAGKYLASKGVSLAKSAWKTASKVAMQLKKVGAAALQWALNPKNMEKIAGMIALIQQGIEVGKAISKMGQGGPPVDQAELDNVGQEKKDAVNAALETTDDDEWSTDEEGEADDDEKAGNIQQDNAQKMRDLTINADKRQTKRMWRQTKQKR